MLFLVCLLPALVGFSIPAIRWKNKKHMEAYLLTFVCINTLLVWSMILNPTIESQNLVGFTGGLTIAFRMDGLSMVFSGLVSALWPLATLYAFEYMSHDKNDKVFFMFYTVTYGVTLGIALAGNMLTMYFFYELLTLVTVPLVMHTLGRKAVLASRKYLYYSLGGAAFAFIGMIFVIVYGNSIDFIWGGVFDPLRLGDRIRFIRTIYVISFFGFGVKAAICPFNSWLPDAGVAPTPVTALLHAVAVVKSGAFAILRLTYYSFGTELLKGTWAQFVPQIFVIITIVYGCSMALKETHIKRRLAYSTISNLSYILFGATLMTPLGFVAALSHLVMHAIMKICCFFCAGAVIHMSGKEYINELDGMGRKMPKIFIIFSIGGLAVMGVPGLCGFVSKWNLVQAALELNSPLAIAGIVSLLISAILTAIYMLSITVRAFVTPEGFDDSHLSGIKDPGLRMMLPLYIFVVCIIVLGLNSAPLIEFFETIAGIGGAV